VRSTAAKPKAVIFGDIYLQEKPDSLIFANSKIKLEISKTSGRWLSLFTDGIGDNLISPTNSPTIDFQIDGEPMIKRHGADFLRISVAVDKKNKAVSFTAILGVPPRRSPVKKSVPPASTDCDFVFSCTYTLFQGEGRLDRSAKLLRNAGKDIPPSDVVRMEGFIFQLPGALIDKSGDCVLDAPGPFWPNRFIAPETPYELLKSRSISFHSAPDAGFGFLAISNKRRNATLASWMDTGGEVAYNSSLHGDGKRISFRHHDKRAYRLPEGATVDSDTHRIELVAGPLTAALAKYRQMCQQWMPLDTDTPPWAREMVILEVYPVYFRDGFKGLTRKLPFYKEVGFNTVYLMPHWIGGYSPIDLFEVNPRLGTSDDLKEMVAATFKSPRWDPNLPYPAYRSGSAAPELMERMLEAMRKIKPDSVLLSEVFGPVFYTVCNLVHDNQTEAPQFLLEKMETGELNARHYKMHMANVFDALPTGANRVYFARNHDTSWFYHFNGYTRRFMALDAIHALCVIPEVFAGDPKHGPNPDDNPETYDYYRKLFALRKDFPELAKGELLLREVECDNRRIFAGLRRLTSQLVLIIVSLSDKEESLTASIRLASNGIKQNKNLNLIDPISGETIEAKVTEPTAVELKLKPFQVLIGRL
jgi:hypothetical protein